MELFCSGNNTILQHPNAGHGKVLFIDYISGGITVELGDAFSFCPINNLTSINLTAEIFRPYLMYRMDIVCCPKDKVNQSDFFFTTQNGPISCLSNTTQLTYMVDGIYAISILPSFCVVLSNNRSVPFNWILDNYFDLGTGVAKYLNATLAWYVPGVTDECKICEAKGKQSAATESFFTHNSKSKSLSPTTG